MKRRKKKTCALTKNFPPGCLFLSAGLHVARTLTVPTAVVDREGGPSRELLVQTKAYTRAPGHCSRPCANSRCVFPPRGGWRRREEESTSGVALASFRAHDGGELWMTANTWEPRTRRRRAERLAQGSVTVSVRARLQTGCNGDNSGVHGRGGGGAASVAEVKGVRRDGRRGGLEQRLLELGSFLDVELGKGALLPKLDSLLLLQHKEGIELLRNLFAIASSCDVAEAHLTAWF